MKKSLHNLIRNLIYIAIIDCGNLISFIDKDVEGKEIGMLMCVFNKYIKT